jgi:hypothetical protein
MKENINRRTFVTQSCACGALLLAGTSHGIDESILLGGERCRTRVRLLERKNE